MRTDRPWALFAVISVVVCAPLPSRSQPEPTAMPTDPAPPAEPDDVTVFVMPVPDSPRARRYMGIFDREVAAAVGTFDVETGLVRHTVPDGSPGVGPEVAQLERFARKRYISPLNSWAYGVGRMTAHTVCAMALAHAQPLSRLHNDPDLLQAVASGLEAHVRAQDESGEWIFSLLRYATIYGSHEMAWRLESLLTAYFCVRDALTEAQRERYWRMLNRAMRFLQRTPCDHANNRGMVWTAAMAMCARATGDSTYLDGARGMWRHICAHVFAPSGMIREGVGPCTLYSPVTYNYLIRYRLMSGDDSLDPVVLRSTDWMAEMYTDQTDVFLGVSTRYECEDGGAYLLRALPGFELFVDERPHFADLSETILDETPKRYSRSVLGNGGVGWITAAWLHRPDAVAAAKGTLPPNYVRRYAEQATAYYTVAQPGYSAMLTLRGLPARKGLQTWAARRSSPFIFPDNGRPSTVQAWGYDLSERDVTEWDAERHDTSDLPSVTGWHGDLAVTYLVSPRSTIVVHSLARTQGRTTIWRGSPRYIAGYQLDGDRVVADGAAGALYGWGPPPTIREDGLAVCYRDTSATQVYALASGRFLRGRDLPPGERAQAAGSLSGGVRLVEWVDDAGHFVTAVNHGAARATAAARLPDGRTESVDLARGQAQVWKVEAAER